MVGTWRQAWLIIGREFKIDRYYLLGSLLFIAYMGFFSGMMLGRLNEEPIMNLWADIMFWVVMSMVGYYFSKRIVKYITEDSYTNTLAYYRTLPIPMQVLALARVIQLLLSTVLNGMLLFVIMYISDFGVREQLSVSQYMVFAFTWIGIGMMLNSLYIAMEFLLKGKAYFWYSLVLLAVVTSVVLILHFSGVHIVQQSMAISADWVAASPALWIFLFLGAASVYASYVCIVKGVPKRDLA